MLSFWQTELNRKNSELTELRDTLKFQETAALKDKDELTLTLASIEGLNKNFEKERSDWDAEKAALEKRASDVEATLNPATEELSGLRQQINDKTSAIFGKHS